MFDSVVFSVLTKLCRHHHYRVPEHFHHPEKKPIPTIPISGHSPSPPLQPLETSNLLSVLMDVPILDSSYIWIHTICGFLCQAFFTQHNVFFIFLNWFIYRERGRKGEREGEKHQCVVSSHTPPTGDWAATQARALTGNQIGDPLVHRPALNPLSYSSQGAAQSFQYSSTL